MEARENGETEQRISLLPAWREAPCYTDRERAAPGWTEASHAFAKDASMRAPMRL
jgi:alkylhydroperoxidase family enzyme